MHGIKGILTIGPVLALNTSLQAAPLAAKHVIAGCPHLSPILVHAPLVDSQAWRNAVKEQNLYTAPGGLASRQVEYGPRVLLEVC